MGHRSAFISVAPSALVCAYAERLPDGKDAGHVGWLNDSYEPALVEDENALVKGRSQAF
jgi:hypothetical protein